jgi:hypothetical protein
MGELTVEEQIDLLRPAVRTGLARRLHWWLIGLAAAFGLVGLVLWHPVPLMISAFLGVVGLAERQAGPNLEVAVKAFDQGTPSTGHASITIKSGDTVDHYHVVLRQEGRPEAAYEFIPQGWRPVAGTHPARIWRMPADGSPVLATIEQGVLIPRRRP